MNRLQSLQRLRSETFDVCVIGGGATGAGCALDAQLRGLQTALIEKEDFAAETSGKSTKLVHGGVRYLEQAVKKLDWGQFRLVQKALKERKTMLDNAPYLAHPLALLTPCYTWWESWYYSIGLQLYDWIAGEANLRPSRRLSRRQALEYLPALAAGRLRGAVLYYDGQFDDARYNVMLAKTATEAGAAVANHLQAIGFKKNSDGKLSAVTVRNRLTEEIFNIRADIFVNAAGPFADTLRQMANPRVSPRVRVSKGAHLVLPREVMPGNTALLIPKTDDGRVIFAIPWLDALLVGTTDTEMQPFDGEGRFGEPVLLAEETDYLLGYLNRYLSTKVTADQVRSGFAGRRPLLQANPDANTKELVRDHEVETDPVSGLLSIMGGKWTTYRLMAQDTVDAVLVALNKGRVTTRTTWHCLSGAGAYTPEGWQTLAGPDEIPAEVAQYWWGKYGTNAARVAQLAREQPQWLEPLAEGYPHRQAEVIYAVRHEMACTLPDVLARRLSLEGVNWQATILAVRRAATLMRSELGWTTEREETETSEYLARLHRYQLMAGKTRMTKNPVVKI